MRLAKAQLLCVAVWLLAGVFVLGAPRSAMAVNGFYYRVQPGENIDGVARRFRVSAYDIAKANRIGVNSQLVGGSQLYIPASPQPRVPQQYAAATNTSSRSAPRSAPKPSKPTQVRVQKGDSLWRISRKYDVSIADLARANGIRQDAVLQVGQVLKLPGESSGGSSPQSSSSSQQPTRSYAPPSRSSGGSTSSTSASSRGFSWPVEGRILRGYESSSTRKHFGINIAVPVGTEIRAARDGTVVYAGSTITAYGNMVIVSHDGGYATCYAFNDRNLVRVNQRVNRGDVIALSGESGKGDEPYVHFQLRRNGDAIDPGPYLP
ncbi:peptidoglycan DD-metalloendopeptidase family protein [bacterium]|nr:peptidoglycan DD-metalloendopeptidase family protein [bacterium]